MNRSSLLHSIFLPESLDQFIFIFVLYFYLYLFIFFFKSTAINLIAFTILQAQFTIMESSLLEQQIRARNEINQLTSFPAELITQILCWLPSFSDILSFAATCRRHRQIWTENVTVIYNHIAPRAIKCRRNARILLADQGGAAADSPVLSVRDVLRLIRNSHIVEKAIARFNRDVVRHVRGRFLSNIYL